MVGWGIIAPIYNCIKQTVSNSATGNIKAALKYQYSDLIFYVLSKHILINE